MAGSTLFLTHYKAARKASQRLTILFWLGVVFSFVFYAAIGYFCISLFSTNSNNDYLITTALLLTLAPCTVLYGYYQARQTFNHRTLVQAMEDLNAKPVHCQPNARERQYLNIIAEMAIAAGVPIPTAFILNKDTSINALALADAKGRSAIAVSAGALKWLNRDELQALVAHEIGHIANEDTILYSRLSAMLSGFFALSEWRNSGDERISIAYERFWHINSAGKFSFFNAFLNEIVGWFGFIMLLYGRWMQARFSREREWMADACSVQFTRQSTALVSTLKKVLALETRQQQHTQPSRAQQHFLFINYRPTRLHFATHPPLEARIRRYGAVVTARELDDLRYQMHEQILHSTLDNVEEKYQRMFASAAVLPILTIERIFKRNTSIKYLPAENSEHQRCAILAFFAYHSSNSLYELQINHIISAEEASLCEGYLKQLNQYHPLNHLALYCQYLRHIDPQALNALSTHHSAKRLIELDAAFNIFEWCYFALLQVQLPTQASSQQHNPTAQAIYHFSAWLAAMHSSAQSHNLPLSLAAQYTHDSENTAADTDMVLKESIARELTRDLDTQEISDEEAQRERVLFRQRQVAKLSAGLSEAQLRQLATATTYSPHPPRHHALEDALAAQNTNANAPAQRHVDDEHQRAAAIYDALSTDSIPGQPPPYQEPTFSNAEMYEGIKHIIVLRHSKAVYRQQLTQVLTRWEAEQAYLSLPVVYLIFTLKRILKQHLA